MKSLNLSRPLSAAKLTKLVCAAAVASVVALGTTATWAQKAKNWTPPKEKLYAQTITDEVMKKHPDVISVGLHGVPPGAAPKAYTMFGSSYPDRVGNADDPDDILVSEGGITILEPGHQDDPVKKFGYMAPLHDGTGKNIGSIVIAFKNENGSLTDAEVLKKGNAIRAEVEKKAPKYEDYFKPAK